MSSPAAANDTNLVLSLRSEIQCTQFLYTDVTLQSGTTHKFIVDTGSTESIISIAVLRSICPQAEIHPTSVRILGVTGHKLPLIAMSNMHTRLQRLIVKCSNNTGGMNVQPDKLKVDGGPIFLKRRVIPYGQRGGVLQALEKMERDGIITRVTSIRNLKNRGEGRVVVKEAEVTKYHEPCFYVIKRAIPLMSDKSNVRCRLWAQRIFRGRNFGIDLVRCAHEPDWRLTHPDEAERLLRAASDPKNAAPDVPVQCVAAMPSLLAVYLQRSGRIPAETIRNAAAASRAKTADEKEADGLLLLTKLPYDPEALQVPVIPSKEELGRIHPPRTVVSENDLVTKPQINRDRYYIRRADTPGLYWRVELEPETKNKNKTIE
ncbi:unnamed protein product [Echinostoma caproni]|uniref:Peptidase A2 domain-containing protein n=1 Tax=Echinostoma caproni TaxID=27848 RepID=A0A183AQA8_9TREM|nr:unnamed protein product [Echinostoma caproni]